MERNLSPKINQLLNMFPVVAILGVRQCGKTTLAKNLRPNWLYMDLEKPSHHERLRHDPELFFAQHPQDVIIDEAQMCPELFSVLRGVIDANRHTKGRFILTGSSSPELVSQISESLAGRMATVQLGTLKINEMLSTPLSAWYQRFDSPLDKQWCDDLPPPIASKDNIKRAWWGGGYPEPALSTETAFQEQWMDHYTKTYLLRDVAHLYPKLNHTTYQRFLSMLSHLSGTILNKAELARALEVSEGTIREHLHISEGTFLWRAIPSEASSHIRSIVKMPKGHMRDTGLLHHLLQLTSPEALFQHPVAGRSFEGFVIEELIKGLEATMLTRWSYHYYRTRAGSEVDLILSGTWGTLPIEIKYGVHTPLKQLRHLKQYIINHDLPFGLVINQAEHACWLDPQIFQLPVGYL